MRNSDMSLHVSRRKPACVLDPGLVLGYAPGPELALRLAQVVDPWLTRSFWQTLDSSELILRRFDGAMLSADGKGFHHSVEAICQWTRMRDQTDASSWALHWIDDSYAQSQLHGAVDVDLLDRYESLAESLLERLPPPDLRWPACALDPVSAATDAVVLSACLRGALILTVVPEDVARTPWPVRALQRVGVHAEALAPRIEDTVGLFGVERQWLREAMVQAGLVAVVQDLPPLAVVHVRVSQPGVDALAESDSDAEAAPHGDLGGVVDAWADARAWWFAL